jgi:hypothetical protein
MQVKIESEGGFIGLELTDTDREGVVGVVITDGPDLLRKCRISKAELKRALKAISQ